MDYPEYFKEDIKILDYCKSGCYQQLPSNIITISDYVYWKSNIYWCKIGVSGAGKNPKVKQHIVPNKW